MTGLGQPSPLSPVQRAWRWARGPPASAGQTQIWQDGTVRGLIIGGSCAAAVGILFLLFADFGGIYEYRTVMHRETYACGEFGTCTRLVPRSSYSYEYFDLTSSPLDFFGIAAPAAALVAATVFAWRRSKATLRAAALLACLAVGLVLLITITFAAYAWEANDWWYDAGFYAGLSGSIGAAACFLFAVQRTGRPAAMANPYAPYAWGGDVARAAPGGQGWAAAPGPAVTPSPSAPGGPKWGTWIDASVIAAPAEAAQHVTNFLLAHGFRARRFQRNCVVTESFAVGVAILLRSREGRLQYRYVQNMSMEANILFLVLLFAAILPSLIAMWIVTSRMKPAAESLRNRIEAALQSSRRPGQVVK